MMFYVPVEPMNSNKPTGLPAAGDKHKGVHKAKEKISLKFKFFQIKKTKYAKKLSGLSLTARVIQLL